MNKLLPMLHTRKVARSVTDLEEDDAVLAT